MTASSKGKKVNFHYLDVTITLPKRTLLKQFIIHMFKTEKKSIKELTVIFCSNEHLLSINQQFLHHDYYTDIITFDLSFDSTIQGEIYISIPQVKENARLFKTRIISELTRVVFHGVLHLCGYKDKKPKERKLMTSLEDKYLSKYATWLSRETRST